MKYDQTEIAGTRKLGRPFMKPEDRTKQKTFRLPPDVIDILQRVENQNKFTSDAIREKFAREQKSI